MIDQAKVEKIKDMLDKYYQSNDSFEQAELSYKIIQQVDWLIKQIESMVLTLNFYSKEVSNLEKVMNTAVGKKIKEKYNHWHLLDKEMKK